MDDIRKAIVFGNSIIDFSCVASIQISVNSFWKTISAGEKSSLYYILTVFYSSGQTQIYSGNRNDVLGLLLYLEKIDFIDRDLIGDFDKFLHRLKTRVNDIEQFDKENHAESNDDD